MSENNKNFISVVVPLFEEEGNVVELHERIVRVLKKINVPSEIIFVDDCSADKTFDLAKKLSPVVALQLRKNSGQSAALDAGIKKSKGNIVVALDGDLENHPEDIPLLLQKFEEGYDVVSGWRKERWEKQKLSRKLPSITANYLISLVSRVRLHDHGCTLKIYRRNILDNLKLQGEKHRMIAAYASIMGADIAEVPVKYSPRKFGKSKYGMMRIFKVLLDSFALMFFNKYSRRPMHFFGGLGFFSFLLGFIIFLVMIYLRFFVGISFIETPLPVLSALCLMVGFQFVLMGLLAEIIVNKDNSSNKDDFNIKDEVRNT
ncbi:MAG: glycosyltransferase family 2 protein [Candidatus Marinimicrobia bacterium]|nr:glycosyltransferase family 2 protein [Candidatus Neomarinimicrobiota bacterium]